MWGACWGLLMLQMNTRNLRHFLHLIYMSGLGLEPEPAGSLCNLVLLQLSHLPSPLHFISCVLAVQNFREMKKNNLLNWGHALTHAFKTSSIEGKESICWYLFCSSICSNASDGHSSSSTVSLIFLHFPLGTVPVAF